LSQRPGDPEHKGAGQGRREERVFFNLQEKEDLIPLFTRKKGTEGAGDREHLSHICISGIRVFYLKQISHAQSGKKRVKPKGGIWPRGMDIFIVQTWTNTEY